MGYLFTTGLISPDGKTHAKLEFDTVSCKHCQGVIKVVKPFHDLVGVKRHQESGAYCRKCHGPVCETKRCMSKCVPWQKRLKLRQEAIELNLRRQAQQSAFWDRLKVGG